MQFANRHDAGRFLASKLSAYKDRLNTIVLALPRGGVPVGYEVAMELHLPLDILVVRKLGFPGNEEFAMGAIASGNVSLIKWGLARSLLVPDRLVQEIVEKERKELKRREDLYRRGLEPLEIRGHTVILVDDGLATGASMEAAVIAVRKQFPASITVAVPVGSSNTCSQFRGKVDQVVCAWIPTYFNAVAEWYLDFRQTSDEEVCELLQSAHERFARRL